MPARDEPHVVALLLRAEDCLAAAFTSLAQSRRLLAATLQEELELVRAIRLSLDGAEALPGQPDVWAPLSARERAYAIRVAAGMATRDIARELRVTPGTAGRVVRRSVRKLGLDNRLQLAAWVLAHSRRRVLAAAETSGLRAQPGPVVAQVLAIDDDGAAVGTAQQGRATRRSGT